MFDPQVGAHKPKLVRNGAIFCAFALIFLYIIYTKPSLPFLSGGGDTVTADFAYAADVVPGRTPVDMYGVVVGVVTGVQRSPSGHGVRLTMTINPGSGVRLHSDATASLRWRTLLGLNYYVDLLPGSTSAPDLGGATIPLSRTTSQTELDQVLEPLNAQGRRALGTMIDQFDAGFADPAAIRSTFRSAGPAMRNLAAGLPALRGEVPGQDLPQLIASTNRWMGTLAADDAALGSMVSNGATALGVTAANQAALGATFDNAPSALAQTQATMQRLRTTLDVLDPVARQLEPGAQKLYGAATQARTALDAAIPLLATLKPTLAAIRPSVNSLASTARTGVPVIRNLTPILTRTQQTFLPWLNSSDPETKLKEYEAVGPTVASVSSALGYGDQYGTLAGFEAGAGESVVDGVSPCKSFLTDPTKSLADKVDCQALAQLLASVFTGSSPTTPLSVITGGVPTRLVNSLLKTGKP
jgi:phospholipid/cholesterol/gamma-HCH transport system substrate-binding protein